jgi:hypothetical protein
LSIHEKITKLNKDNNLNNIFMLHQVVGFLLKDIVNINFHICPAFINRGN